MMKKYRYNKWIVTLFSASACLFAAVFFLFAAGSLFFSAPEQTAVDTPWESSGDYSIMETFDEWMSFTLTEAEAAVRSVPKHFTIAPDAECCPVPNQDCFGQADSASELQWLLEEAAPLLDGQETVFTMDTPIMEGSVVRYYLDETILAITWKQVFDNFVYTISEIKIQDPSQFRRYIVSDDMHDLHYYQTSEMSQKVNAVVASSADFYKNRPYGIVVYDGQVKRSNRLGLMEACFIDAKGDLLFTERGEFGDKADLEAYVADHDIRFSLVFGPVLIDNYELRPLESYPMGEIHDGYPRCAIAQKGELHYVLIAATAEGPYKSYVDIPTFAKNIATLGCMKAYALDGGRTVTVTMNHELVNSINYDEPRKTGDCIYFGSALPNYSDTQE